MKQRPRLAPRRAPAYAASVPANQPSVATTVKPEPTALQPYAPGRKRGGNRGLEQAYLLRDLAARTAIQLGEEPLTKGETRASRTGPIAAMMKSFVLLSDRVRILRGRPLPAPLRGGKPAPVRRPKGSPAPSLASLAKAPDLGQL